LKSEEVGFAQKILEADAAAVDERLPALHRFERQLLLFVVRKAGQIEVWDLQRSDVASVGRPNGCALSHRAGRSASARGEAILSALADAERMAPDYRPEEDAS
jgi:hypothetical protein